MSAFERAIRRGDADGVRLDLLAGADPNRGSVLLPLGLAAMLGQVEVMRVLVDAGAEIDWRDRVGRTALSHAAEGPRVEPVRFLLDAGAAVDALDDDGLTPLLRGVFSMDTSEAVVAALVAAGADVSVRDPDYGMTPFEWAEKRSWRGLLAP